MTEFAAFKEKWCHPDYPPTAVDLAALERVGNQLGVTFPTAYVAAMGEVGALSTTLGLLHVITTQQANLHDLTALHAPADILSSTTGWRQAGMPNWLVAIGSDCAGNSFCFDTRKKGLLRRQSHAIYFWDHDFGDTTEIARSFEDWIKSYLSLPGNYDSWKDADVQGKTPAACATGVP